MSKAVTMAGWDDVPHLDEQAKKEMLESTPPHMIESRSRGVPGLGAGAIYPVPEVDIVVAPFELPSYYRRFYGMDVGWNFTAVAFMALDPDQDIVYIHDAYKRTKAEPEVHASAIKRRYPGKQVIAGAIDPAARSRSQVDGRNLMKIYRDEGLKIIPADNAREAGIEEMWSRLSTGRMKVFNHLTDWLDEYRLYRRDEQGRIVKENDHYMDATRYGVMSGIKVARPIVKDDVIISAGGRSYF